MIIIRRIIEHNSHHDPAETIERVVEREVVLRIAKCANQD